MDTVPLSNGEKARIIGDLFDQGREADAYIAMEHMLRVRMWPKWLDEVCADIDGPKDIPVNLKEAA